MTTSNPSPSVVARRAGLHVIWFLAYLAVGAIVVTWQPASGTSVWYPPIAVGMAYLLRHGIRWLPLVFVADLLVAFRQFDQGWSVATIVAGSTAAEVLVAVLLLRALRFDVALRSGTDFLWLVVAAGGAATAVGSTLGSLLISTLQPVAAPLFGTTWRTWWIGDSTGVIVLLPALLLMFDRRDAATTTGSLGMTSLLERIGLFASAAIVCVWLFPGGGPAVAHRVGFEVFAFLPVVWSAIRFNARTTALTIVCIDVGALGLFLSEGPTGVIDHWGMVHLQLFMVGVSLAGIPLAISLAGLRDAQAALRRQGDGLADIVRERTIALEEALRGEQTANAAKTEFLANISHELRTPMHAIRSFANLGLERAEHADRDKLAGYFRRIDTSSRRLLALLNDLLDLSKLEAGRMELDLRPVEVAAAVRLAMEEAEPLAAARDITMRSSDTSVGIVVRADAARLQQVLLNVLSNAIKFSDVGGHVEVEISSDDRGDGRWARVTVTDAGIGVPEGEMDAIFDKFVQSTKTRSGAGGTGLGLAICREFLRAHGGTIHAEHAPVRGTRIVITLPA